MVVLSFTENLNCIDSSAEEIFMKKFLVTALIAGVVISSVSFMCLAHWSNYGEGCTHANNGSYWYDQGWVDIYAIDQTHTAMVGVRKPDGYVYGKKPTTISAGSLTHCTSYKVQGSGGVQDWSVN